MWPYLTQLYLRAGSRRVINLSEEQRQKKRLNDRLAQQNIRRKNKETIENLKREVAMLKSLQSVQTAMRLIEEKRELETRLIQLSHHVMMWDERHSHPPSMFSATPSQPTTLTGRGPDCSDI
jgi:uncharacterized protein YhaN